MPKRSALPTLPPVYPQKEEHTLLQRCLQGDQEALRLLFERYKSNVYRLAQRLTRHPHDADDILQEVFLRVWRHLHTFQQQSAFSSWLYRITINTTHSYLSKHQRHQHDPLAELPQQHTLEHDPFLRKNLLHALHLLPERYKEVLVLHDIEGFTHNEIAEILEIEIGTSKSQLHKARQRMLALLQGNPR